MRLHPDSVFRGSKNGNAKLSESRARAVKAAKGSHLAVAGRFNISESQVSNIKNERQCSHLLSV